MSETTVTTASIYDTSRRNQPWLHSGSGIEPEVSTVHAFRALGPLVYAILMVDGLIKIGYSTDFAKRRRHIGGQSSQMLAIIPGATHADEQALHARLADHVHHGREYYYPTPGVWRVLNEMREQLGLTSMP